ncbi:isopentenyl-diphosphate delta-isomerase [Neolewinella lacunae]|uniref:Isopentenyl-diphosphate delta-isomerase n=1 Tax=Neolewinella lacunae TaxID=1517758 RepID=A0A923TED6_9BACT|nr:isopentenyl-diphosphate delta-isomerase [Neolewinella lacunae]MBC6995802.1 isopentenyl-diphosphate delta-isomerase [Neolewinella lacunae]MDN3636505.1 isopentenyl-diphosphate delta-isomerase [Neolewinella lacunae]
MSEKNAGTLPPQPAEDPTAERRKEDHIELAFRSQVEALGLDPRFDYEPLLAAHPAPGSLTPVSFGQKQLRAPLWVSSMTGGTEKAFVINHNLARACAEFGLGMGLGSCRPLLYGHERLRDFDVRPITGDDVPLYANLGVAQIQDLLDAGRAGEIQQLVEALRVDGLIVHVNPLQEALQPEGDRFRVSPLATIEALLAALPELAVIVKEVGQGMGPASLRALLRLPLLAIDTAAGGGTNFSKLELFRSDDLDREAFGPLTRVGHTAAEMVQTVNALLAESSTGARPQVQCKSLIVSGGVANFLDGYYLTKQSTLLAIYGQASAFLRYAREDYPTLRRYVASQVRGLELAEAYLRPRF